MNAIFQQLKWTFPMTIALVLLSSVYLTHRAGVKKSKEGTAFENVGGMQSLKQNVPGPEKIYTVAQRDLVQSWMERREAALSESSKRKVLLFCYMNGGSTFFGDIFMKNMEATFWYEPVAAFYMAYYGASSFMYPQDIFWYGSSYNMSKVRNLPQWEVDGLVKYNHDLLTCNITALPRNTLSHIGMNHSSFRNHIQCILNNSNNVEVNACRNRYILNACKGNMENFVNNKCPEYVEIVSRHLKQHHHPLIDDATIELLLDSVPENFINYEKCSETYFQTNVAPCLHHVVEQCRSSKLITYKVLRYWMKHVGSMLENDPDMHVIYLVRDPRSIVSSRLSNHLTYRASARGPVIEAQYLCAKMMDDLKAYKTLSEIYKGAMKFVRYEDLVMYPKEVIPSIYSFVNHTIPPRLQDMVNNLLVKDSDIQSNKWRGSIPEKHHDAMSRVCRDVIQELGYPPS